MSEPDWFANARALKARNSALTLAQIAEHFAVSISMAHLALHPRKYQEHKLKAANNARNRTGSKIEGRRVADMCTEQGAQKAAERLQAYWGAQGYRIEVRVVKAEPHWRMKGEHWRIETDMVNGLPRGWRGERAA